MTWSRCRHYFGRVHLRGGRSERQAGSDLAEEKGRERQPARRSKGEGDPAKKGFDFPTDNSATQRAQLTQATTPALPRIDLQPCGPPWLSREPSPFASLPLSATSLAPSQLATELGSSSALLRITCHLSAYSTTTSASSRQTTPRPSSCRAPRRSQRLPSQLVGRGAHCKYHSNLHHLPQIQLHLHYLQHIDIVHLVLLSPR